ncbi:hypothetical protein GDO86_015378 [Hymenochirus boettgeri]|uniref:Uncharacterized protein n=1 Tax=Hymenochirus boettgeri TaxID=247094 RepID=A0A8T2K0S8_9PIPI|nr:hypothetical protein GDO86_015378 [Hymenochirus boettgeri]
MDTTGRVLQQNNKDFRKYNNIGKTTGTQETVMTSSPRLRRVEGTKRIPSPATISRRKRGTRGSIWSTVGPLPIGGAWISVTSIDTTDGPEEQLLDSSDTSLVLDPKEHAWMLMATEGNYNELKEFLWEDPSLLYKKDFVTGYSIIHWMAKHGHHEDLIRLMDFAFESGNPLDINTRASGGLTPLHIAVMQGNIMSVKVLVGAFNANIHARDHNGCKAWQYLKPDNTGQLQELLGAPEEEAGAFSGMNINNNCHSSSLKDCVETDSVSKIMMSVSPLQNLFKTAYSFLKKW